MKEAVADEERDQDRPVHEERGVRGPLQEAHEDVETELAGGRRLRKRCGRAGVLTPGLLPAVVPRVPQDLQAVGDEEECERALDPAVRHHLLEPPAEAEPDEAADESIHGRASEGHAEGLPAPALKTLPEDRDVQGPRGDGSEEAREKTDQGGDRKVVHAEGDPLTSTPIAAPHPRA